MEKWKNIEFIEGYQVSSYGNIRRTSAEIIFHNGHKICHRYMPNLNLKSPIDRYGYNSIIIRKKRYLIHRLVAKAFIDNSNNLLEINHIDGNKLNNHIENLEWCTHKENMLHAFNTGLNTFKISSVSYRPVKKITEAKCKEIREKYNNKEKKYTYDLLAKEYGMHKDTIGLIIRNKLT